MMLDSEFENNNIDQLNKVNLPHLETLNLLPLAAQYAPLNLLINLVISLFIVIIGGVLYTQPWINLPPAMLQFIPYAMIFVAVISIILIPLNYIGDKHKLYALRELDLHFSSGLIFKKLVSQPISRIQHVELKRGPLERYKNLATLQVFSAGGAQHTFEIPGLDLDTAQQIHQFVLQHKDLAQHG
ncbi:PH domain-containing protein [Paraglaciecola sp. 25GB23A]|uniref:PH domain-containing protein n=1 Tax=Paraglaciecola sp. 25GB23A TaxID=3156068 RepID=UPI0032AF41C8